MYCKKCGSALNDAAVFCPNCGQTLQNKQTAPAGGGYAQQQSGYAAYPGTVPQPGNAYPAYRKPGTSANGLMLIAMAFLVIISAIGLLNFSVYKSGAEWLYSANGTNASIWATVLHTTDGDIFEAFGELLEDNDAVLAGICAIASLIMTFVAVLFAVIGLICALIKSYSAAAATMGIGLFTAAFGYLANSIEGLNLVSEADSDYVHMGIASPAMFIICIVLGVIAFVAAGRMKNSD